MPSWSLSTRVVFVAVVPAPAVPLGTITPVGTTFPTTVDTMSRLLSARPSETWDQRCGTGTVGTVTF